MSPDMEAAWTQWSKGIAECDARTIALLRAAFWAGYEARPTSCSG